MTKSRNIIETVAVLYVCFVFIQSLFFKFTYAPETEYIFGVLDKWAASFGFEGLFSPYGLFSAYVIGSAELVASALMLLSFKPQWRILRPLGAILTMAIMSGAICFHLFTPLGVNVQDDGGLLFIMACGVWLAGLYLLVGNRSLILMLLKK
jgi:uncharacterized membrane protein YphA (DoxX/SURF4 family)